MISLGSGQNDLQDWIITPGSTKRPPGTPNDLQGYWDHGPDYTTRSSHLNFGSTGNGKIDHQ